MYHSNLYRVALEIYYIQNLPLFQFFVLHGAGYFDSCDVVTFRLVNMQRYTIEQRVFIVKNYFKFGEIFAEVGRKFRTKYDGRENCPSTMQIKRIIEKFEESGSVKYDKRQFYHRSGRLNKNIAAVSTSINEQPSTSIRHRSQQLNVKPTTLFNILHKDLHLKSYKIQLFQ